MKSKLYLSLIISLLLAFYSLGQNLQVVKEFNSSHYELRGLEINLTSEKILIARDNQNIFIDNLIGKKIFQKSRNQNCFLIANFKFSNEKVDYPVEIMVFDVQGNMLFTQKFLAPYDLPHPLFQLNDNALLALFDPLSFKVKLVGQETYNEIKLEKDISFEMEKASFMEINEDLLYVLTSQSALDISENVSNVKLYKVNLFDLTVDKRELNYNTPTLLKLVGGNLFVSGVRFENLKPLGKTIKYNLQLNQLASNERIIEKLIPYENRFYAKYFNAIFELESDLTVSREYQLSGNERIFDIAKSSEKLIVVTNIAEKINLYCFLPGLSIDFKAELDNFGINKMESFSIFNDNIIIRCDSKSIKIKVNVN